MKRQDEFSCVTDAEAQRMGGEMAIQFMLMTLFQMVSEMADDPRALRAEVHDEVASLVADYKMPPMPEDSERKVKSAATKILDNLMLRSFEQPSAAAS